MSETALITGASSGLGMEYAKLFAADKRDVVLVARRRDRLHALANELTGKWGIKAYVIAEDLVDPAAPQRIVEEVKRDGLQIDYLVNNAGFGATGPFAQTDLARELAMVQVNITALVALTRAFLPEMIQRKRGRVLNIGSSAGAGNDRTRLFKLGAMNAAEVARQGYQAMLEGKPLVIHGLKNRILAGSVRISPRPIVRAISASMNRPPGPRQTLDIKP